MAISAEELRIACQEKDLNKFNKIIAEISKKNEISKINEMDKLGSTALHYACNGKNKKIIMEMVNSLLDLKALVDVKNVDGWTPLYIAAKNGYFELCEKLLHSKASINLADNSNYTPLCVATQGKRIKIVNLLIAHSAKLDIITTTGCNLLHFAALANNPELIELYCLKGIRVNNKNSLGYTPLHLAANVGNLDAVLQLINFGADINLLTNNKNKAVTLASKGGYDDIVDVLEKELIDKTIVLNNYEFSSEKEVLLKKGEKEKNRQDFKKSDEEDILFQKQQKLTPNNEMQIMNVIHTKQENLSLQGFRDVPLRFSNKMLKYEATGQISDLKNLKKRRNLFCFIL